MVVAGPELPRCLEELAVEAMCVPNSRHASRLTITHPTSEPSLSLQALKMWSSTLSQRLAKLSFNLI